MPYNLFRNCAPVKLRQASIPKESRFRQPRARNLAVQNRVAFVAYILDTFPTVRPHDKAAFSHYRTKDMVLAYDNALAAGDTDAEVAV